MMDEVFVPLRTALVAKGVPFELVYGPTHVPPQVGASRVQLLRDYESGDQIGAPRGRFPNPSVFATLSMGAIVRIHAMSTVDGAGRLDHEILADRIADQVLVELHKVIRGAKTLYQIKRTGYVVDLTIPDGWSGVVYEIAFSVDRSVPDVPWVGGAAGEMTMTATTAKTTLDASSSPAPTTDLPSATTRIP